MTNKELIAKGSIIINAPIGRGVECFGEPRKNQAGPVRDKRRFGLERRKLHRLEKRLKRKALSGVAKRFYAD